MLIVRPGIRDDIGAVDALLRRSYGALLRADYPPSTLVLALPTMARAQPALLASGRYFVAEEDGKILGVGGWSAEPPRGGAPVPGLGHVRHVATDARVARRGVGRAVMGHVVSNAAAAGVRRMLCLSTLSAMPFYAALGFGTLRPLTLQINGAPFPVMEMAYEL